MERLGQHAVDGTVSKDCLAAGVKVGEPHRYKSSTYDNDGEHVYVRARITIIKQ